MNEKKRVIRIVAHDPTWAVAFQRESEAIREALTQQVIQIHHIGSTAVPGLKAKPVIDILLVVKDVGALDDFDSEMKSLGYIPKGEFDIPGRRFYLKGLYDRTHHVHAFNVGSPDVRRHIAFRDYLVAHPAIAKEYETLKVRCADECGNDNDKYCDGKHEFVQEHEKKAIEWVKCQPNAPADLPGPRLSGAAPPNS